MGVFKNVLKKLGEETLETESSEVSTGERYGVPLDNTAEDSEEEEKDLAILATGIVEKAYSKFSDPSAERLYRVENIGQTLKVTDMETRNSMIRDLLLQFGENLDDLIKDALNRSDSIQSVQKEEKVHFEEESKHIENEIEKKKEEIREQERQLEAFIKKTNQEIEALEESKLQKEKELNANLNGANAEIQRLNEIMSVLTGEE